MKLRITSFICLFILLSGNVFSQADKLTLSFEEALNMSYKNNSIFKQNDLLKREKEQERKAAFGLYMPQVSLSANYVYMQKDLHLDMTPVRDAITPLYDILGNYGNFKGVSIPGMPGRYLIDPTTGKPAMNPMTKKPLDVSNLPSVISGGSETDFMNSKLRPQIAAGKDKVMSAQWDQMIQKKSFATLGVNMMWPLYAGGKIRAANKVAKLKMTEADLKAEQKTFKHIDQMVERYYGLCLAQQVKTVREDVYKAMKNHMRDAEKMYKSGLIAKVQYLHAKVFFDDADREYKKSKRQVSVVKKGLSNTLGIEKTDIITISKLFYLKEIKDLDYYKNSAKENSPILKMVENKKSMARQKYKVERADLLPSVAAMGMYDIANKDLSHMMPEYMVGIGLKWNIFSGQKSYRKTKAAKLTIERVGQIKEKYESDINTGITKYYETLQMYIEQLEALNTSMSFANEYYSVRDKSFKEGMATSTELVDAKLVVTKVQIDRLKVLYDFDVCLSKLLELSGLSHNFVAIQQSIDVINEEYKN
ncbi:MAG: TolC family protein [Marinifilaceae bacterium]